MDPLPVERYANFGQEYLQVLATQVLLSRNPDFFKNFAAPNARVRVDSCERIVVITRLEVRFFLLRELHSHPRHNRWDN
jgi:hypothetical protein